MFWTELKTENENQKRLKLSLQRSQQNVIDFSVSKRLLTGAETCFAYLIKIQQKESNEYHIKT